MTPNLNTFIEYLRPYQIDNTAIKELIVNLEERSFLGKPYSDLVSKSPGKEFYNAFMNGIQKSNYQSYEPNVPNTSYAHTTTSYAPYVPNVPNTSYTSSAPYVPYAQNTPYVQNTQTTSYTPYAQNTQYVSNTQYVQTAPYTPYLPHAPSAPLYYGEYHKPDIPIKSIKPINSGYFANPFISETDVQKKADEIFMMSDRFTKSKFYRDKICEFSFLIQFVTLLQFTVHEGNWSAVNSFLENNDAFIKTLTSAYDGMISSDPYIQQNQCALIDSFTWS